MNASKIETYLVRAFRALVAVCLSIFPGAKRPADDTDSYIENVTRPAGGRTTVPKKKVTSDYTADFVFLLGLICIALMILLGLAIPAIMATGLCLLLIESLTRYRAAFTGKAIPS